MPTNKSSSSSHQAHLNGAVSLTFNKLEICSYILAAFLLFLVLKLKLLSSLLAGLLVYQLICMISPFIARRVSSKISRWISAVVIASLIVGIFTGIIIGIASHIEHTVQNLQSLLDKAMEIIEQTRLRMPGWIAETLPMDTDQVKNQSMNFLNTHMTQLQQGGKSLARGIGHIIFGMIVGAMIAVDSLTRHAHKPLAKIMIERIKILADSFRKIVFAQIKISAINTFFTSVYLLILLPLLHQPIPLSKTLVLVTFIAGLLPVIGNLISNTFIVAFSLSVSLETAMISLAFLIIIHKLEYFLNAKIMGGKVESKAWEILLAMLVLQAAFGVSGMIAAPIFYGYIKKELTLLKLI